MSNSKKVLLETHTHRCHPCSCCSIVVMTGNAAAMEDRTALTMAFNLNYLAIASCNIAIVAICSLNYSS